MTHREKRGRFSLRSPKRRVVVIAGGALLFLAVLAGAWLLTLLGKYGDIDQVLYDPGGAVAAIGEMTEQDTAAASLDVEAIEQAQLAQELAELDEQVMADVLASIEEAKRRDPAVYENPFAASPALPDDMFRSYLLIGSDASGYLADVIILFLQPTDGSAPIIASLPRDMYIPNACSGKYSRVNSNLGGCVGVANGPTLLALSVAGFTGIEIDHFAVVDFDGFSRVVDVLGGLDLCFDHPTRDTKSQLQVDAGCARADGATTLAWVRSRQTEQLVDGQWVSIGASDFTRQRKQQEVIFLVTTKLTKFSSLTSLQSVADTLATSVRLDSGFAFASALSLAWDYRGLDRNQVNRVSLDFDNLRTPQGALVLAPTRSFNDALSDVYPSAAK